MKMRSENRSARLPSRRSNSRFGWAVAFAALCAASAVCAADWTCYPIFPEGADYAVESRSPASFVLRAARTDEKVVKTGCLAIANLNTNVWTHGKLVLHVRSLNGKMVRVAATLSHDTPAGVVMKTPPQIEVSGRAWREVVYALDADYGLGDAAVMIRQVKIGAWVSGWHGGEAGGIEVKGLRLCGPTEVNTSDVWRPGDTFVSIPRAGREETTARPDALRVFFAFDNEDVVDSVHAAKLFRDRQQFGGFSETMLAHTDGHAVMTADLDRADVIVYSRARPDGTLAARIAAAVRERGVPLYAASEIGDPAVEAVLPCMIGHEVPQDFPRRARVSAAAGADVSAVGLSSAAFGVYRGCTEKPGARALFRFADGTPAVVEGRAGKGRVIYSMLAVGQSLVPGKKSPDAFFIRMLGRLSGRCLPESARTPAAGESAAEWRAGADDACFGRFGWEVGSGLLVGGLGSRLDVRNNAAGYAFAAPRSGDRPRKVAFAGNFANQLALDGDVVTENRKTAHVTASLGYPGIRWEISRNDIELYLENLQFAAAVPTADGVRIVRLSEGEEIGPAALAKPWILLFNGAEKDAPLLLVLQRRPARIAALRSGAAVRGLRFSVSSGGLGVIVPTWVYGTQTVDTQTWEKGLPDDARRRIDLWHPRALAYPSACRERFRLDERRKRVEIRSCYGYLRYADEWGTAPARYAPVSPVAWTLHDVMPAAGGGPIARFGLDVRTTGLVTRFGDLAVRGGTNEVCWSLPLFAPATGCLPHVAGTAEFETVANDCFAGGVRFTCGGGVKVDYARDRTRPFRRDEIFNISMHSHLAGLTRAPVNPFIYSPENRALLRRRMAWRLFEPFEVLQYKMTARWRREPVSGVRYTIYMNSPRDIATVYEPETYGSKIIYGDSNETVRMILASAQIAADRMGQADFVRANWDALSRHVPSYAFANDDWLNLCSGCLEWGGPGTIDMLNAEFGSMMSLARLAEIAGDETVRAQALYRASRRICPTLARLKMLDYHARHGLLDRPELRRQSTGFTEDGAAFPLRVRPPHEMDFLDMSQGIPQDLLALYGWYGYTELRGDWFRQMRSLDGAGGTLDYRKIAALAVGGGLSSADLLAKLKDIANNARYMKWLPTDWPGMGAGSYIEYALHRIYGGLAITDCRDLDLHDAVWNPQTQVLTLDVTPGPAAALAVNGRPVALPPAGTPRRLDVRCAIRPEER